METPIMSASGRKLLILIPSPGRGGAEDYALKVAQGARQAGWGGLMCCPGAPELDSLAADFQSAGYACLRRDLRYASWWSGPRKLFRTAAAFVQTLRLARQCKPGAVFVVMHWPLSMYGALLACAWLRLKTVVSFQLVTPELVVSPRRARVMAWARRRNQTWVAASENNRQLLADRFLCPAGEIRMIRNGAPAPVERGEADRQTLRRQVREELGLEAGCALFLTVGTVCARKGADLLAQAAPFVLRRHPRAAFAWAGGGDPSPLRQAAARAGVESRLLALGHRSDIPRLLAAADFFVLPTRSEGQPFALLEAMSAGAPIITSDASGIPEIITHGQDGLVFESGDPVALVEQLLFALENPRDMARMAQRAPVRAAGFSEADMVARTLALLEPDR